MTKKIIIGTSILWVCFLFGVYISDNAYTADGQYCRQYYSKSITACMESLGH